MPLPAVVRAGRGARAAPGWHLAHAWLLPAAGPGAQGLPALAATLCGGAAPRVLVIPAVAPAQGRARGLLAAAGGTGQPALARRFPHACHCPGAPGGDALPTSLHLPAASAGIQRVLEREPTAGAAGALLDALRVAWGACPRWLVPRAVLEQRPALGRRCLCTRRVQHACLDPFAPPPSLQAGARLFAVFLAAVITPLHMLPLVPYLLLQVYAILMVRQHGGLGMGV